MCICLWNEEQWVNLLEEWEAGEFVEEWEAGEAVSGKVGSSEGVCGIVGSR